MNNNTMKRCTKCKQELPLNEYYIQKDKPSGYSSHCKRCRRIAGYRKDHGDNWINALQVYWLEQAIESRLASRGLKQCTHCKVVYPATLEYFYPSKGKLFCQCKPCQIEQKRQDRLANPEKAKDRDRQYYANNKEKIHERYQQQRATDPEKARIAWRKSYAANRDEIVKRRRQRYIENWDVLRAKRLIYRAKNPDKSRQYNQRYYATHPNIKQSLLLSKSRRRARKQSLPDTLTTQQWQACLDYFNHRCAVCGRPRGLWHTLAPDHWIPLSDKRPDNPGTVVNNIVPLCHGVDGCNNSKRDYPAEQWLSRQFSKRKVKQILARIYAYFNATL